MEQERLHLKPDFDVHALGQLLDISQERLTRLFRQRTIFRTPEAYVDNLRILAALRLLCSHPNYTIVTVAREAGFNSCERTNGVTRCVTFINDIGEIQTVTNTVHHSCLDGSLTVSLRQNHCNDKLVFKVDINGLPITSHHCSRTKHVIKILLIVYYQFVSPISKMVVDVIIIHASIVGSHASQIHCARREHHSHCHDHNAKE